MFFLVKITIFLSKFIRDYRKRKITLFQIYLYLFIAELYLIIKDNIIEQLQ